MIIQWHVASSVQSLKVFPSLKCIRSSDEESVEERRRSANSNNNSGLSMRLMPLNIPALMTSPQSKVAPAAPALTLNGLLMAAGEKE